MAKFISKIEIVEALRNYNLATDSRLTWTDQREEKRKLCEQYIELISALDLDKCAKFDLDQLNSDLLGTSGNVEDNVYRYLAACKDLAQFEAELKELYTTLKDVATKKPQDKAEEIAATISEATLIKFGIFFAVALALAIAAVVMTVLGLTGVVKKEISDGTATVIGLVDLVLGLSFFIYERYTDMRKDMVRKQAKEYPDEFAKQYQQIVSNSAANIIGNNNRVVGLFVSMKNSVTVNMSTKLKNSANAMKQIKKFKVNDIGEE